MRLQLILCDMLALPVETLAPGSPHEIIVSDLSASLHNEPVPLRDRIQEHVDRIESEDPEVDAILLGYGYCGGATGGLTSKRVPLVLPRAHDCVTIFLGSRERYMREQESTPGTYWFTEDNVKRGNAFMGRLLGSSERSDGVSATYEEYVEKYGKENADYLMEALGEWQQHYTRGAFLETGMAPDDVAKERAEAETLERGWRFESVLSELGLVERLLGGEWNEDFLVIEPGEAVALSYDDDVVKAVPAKPAEAPAS